MVLTCQQSLNISHNLSRFYGSFFCLVFLHIRYEKYLASTKGEINMEKCLTQAERQEKKTAIKYLRGELKEHLD